MFVGNVSEDGFENNPLLDSLKAYAEAQGAPVVAICAKIEAEMAEMSDEDRDMFLQELGLEEPGLNRLIRAGFGLLGLQTYFTAGVKEVRAWTIKDRKSTRLNSSHLVISYAVFCLKKKNDSAV